MSILDQLSEEDDDIRAAVRTVREAELAGDERHDSGASKNAHFEYKFRSPGMSVYIERYDAEPGVEVMIWADRDWFSKHILNTTDHPVPSNGKPPLSEFAKTLLDIVANELEQDQTPSFEFHSMAPPSLVFSAVFYVSE